MINDFFLTLVPYSLRIIKPNTFILFICHSFYKNIVHGWYLFVVTHHLIMIEKKLRQLITADAILFFYAQVGEFVIALFRQQREGGMRIIKFITQEAETKNIGPVILSDIEHFPL